MITMYGTEWCGDCRRAKRLLDQEGVAYAYVDVEGDDAATELVIRLNGGRRIVPTIVFEDGTVLAEPSNAQLQAKLRAA